MTVRQAELWMAVILALCSAAIMYKSTDGLSIGWIKGSGPGAGAWPFWLATGMLLSCLTILYRWYTGATAVSRSTEPFIDRSISTVILTTIAALVVLLLATSYISLYIALILFLIFYLRIMGHHTWGLTLTLAIVMPVVLFLFFEWALKIPLPKGHPTYVEPLFYPLYDLIY